MIEVNLLDAIGLGILIPFPTGVVYTNQAGGFSCLSPKVEGFYVPICNDIGSDGKLISPESELFEYFSGNKWKGSGATSGLDHQDADAIEEIFLKYNLQKSLTVDRDKLNQSCEAWIHILVSPYELKRILVTGQLKSAEAIMTWANSD